MVSFRFKDRSLSRQRNESFPRSGKSFLSSSKLSSAVCSSSRAAGDRDYLGVGSLSGHIGYPGETLEKLGFGAISGFDVDGPGMVSELEK